MKRFLFLFRVLTLCIVLLAGWGQNVAALESGEYKGHYSSVKLVAAGFGKEADGRDYLKTVLDIDLDDGWMTYWRTSGDAGLPVNVSAEESMNVTGLEMLWPVPRRYVEAFDLEAYGYKDDVQFPVKLFLKDAGAETGVRLKVNYMVCNDQCLPVEMNITLDVPKKEGFSGTDDFEDALKKIPGKNGALGFEIESHEFAGGKFVVRAVSSNGFSEPDIYVENEDGYRFPKPEVNVAEGGKEAAFTFAYQDANGAAGQGEPKLTRLTLVDGVAAVEKVIGAQDVPVSQKPLAAAPDIPLAKVLLFAVLGGLILNIMPCVLPVLSIKLLSAVKHGGGDRRHITASFLASALGIVSSFVVLAVIAAALKYGGEAVGWGLHFQEPVFVITLALLVTVFAANLFGLFEVSLPAFLSGAVNFGADKKGLTGDFLSGVLATVLATPCSAPFLGTAVGFSLSRGAAEIMVTFLFMGLGLALPYLFFAIFPQFVSKLPRPGAWMKRVKQLMGLLLMATALWLVWVLAGQIGANAAYALLFMLYLIIALFWAFRAGGDRLGAKARMVIMIVALTLSYLVPFRIAERVQLSKAMEDIWQPLDEARIPELVAGGKIVFVDVTADWCITCKANKVFVLETDEIMPLLKADGVVAMKGDWTNHDPRIAEYLKSFGRYGIPFNAVYSKKYPYGKPLPELLTKEVVREAIEGD